MPRVSQRNWQAAVHGIARVGHDLATKPPPPPSMKRRELPFKAL